MLITQWRATQIAAGVKLMLLSMETLGDENRKRASYPDSFAFNTTTNGNAQFRPARNCNGV